MKGDYDMKPYKELSKNELLTVKAALEEEAKADGESVEG